MTGHREPLVDPIAVGQVWRHVGFEDTHGAVPGTGLRVRVVRRESGHRNPWICDYPDEPSKGTRHYPRGPWRGYALEGAE